MPTKVGFVAAASLCLLAVVPRAQAPADPGAALYERNRVLQVDIQMAAADWREVRLSHRTGNTLGTPTPSDEGYEYRRAQVRIDGVTVANVGVRKKGFVGSVVSTRPSLKLKFDEYVSGQLFSGVDGLTLNNNNQDQTLVQTFLAYDLFKRAGVPAPRASFAHVRVNGEDLGVYTNVEPVGKSFLRRAFGSDNGVLYESYAGDFVGDRVSQIIEKSGAADQDRGRLVRLGNLLAAPGPLALPAVEAAVDLDSFIRMWAAESLIGHWDSYSANRNNYYVYAHPKTGKLHFIPWGPDAVFADPGPLQIKVVPKSFKAEGILARRLWELPEVRRRYHAAMRVLLSGPWTESRLNADIASLQSLLQLQSTIRKDAMARATETAQAFITTRRAEVEAELKEPAPTWPPATEAQLNPTPFTLSGSFTAPWMASAPANPLASGSARLELRLAGGTPVVFKQVGAFAGTHDQMGVGLAPIRDRYQVVTLTGLAGTEIWQLQLTIDPYRFETDRSLPADLYAVWAIVVKIAPPSPTPMISLWGNTGEVSLEQASAVAGGSVRGGFTLRGIAAP